MAKQPLICKKCNIAMNHHADKEDQSTGTVIEVHTCPKCGAIETRVEE
jgi:Zn finger protein HypA/HybF involved in hydrogenase expression